MIAREMSSEIDETTSPEELVVLLGESGLLRAGGAPAVALPCAEAVARGGGKTGWSVSIAITSSLLVAYLPASSRDQREGRPRRRRSVGTTHNADGRWRGRGVGALGVLQRNLARGHDVPPAASAGVARVPSGMGAARDLQVLDTWHTLGLRGTGGRDTVADEVFVTADRVFSLFDGPKLDRPLYRYPVFGFFALSSPAAALRAMRAAGSTTSSRWREQRRGLGQKPARWRSAPRPEPRWRPRSRRWALRQHCITRRSRRGWQASQDGETRVGRGAKPTASGGN